MGVRQSFFTLALATLGLSLSPSAASAISLGYLSSDTELQTLFPSPAFIAHGQISNIALNGNFESTALSRHFQFVCYKAKAEGTKGQVDFVWSNGQKQPFSLTYDGSIVRYSVGNRTLENKITGSFKDIFIYTRAREDGSRMLLDTLLLKDSSMTLSVSSVSATGKNGGLSILGINNILGSFTLTGNATMSWMNNPQKSSNIAYQIQVGNVEASIPVPEPAPVGNVNSPTPVPEPSTIMGLLLGSGAIAFCTRIL
jgi:hypothetical protein